MKNFAKGFTLPELVISLGILTIIFGITIVTLIGSQRVTETSALVDTLLADIRDQQNKAMAQNTAGASDNYDFGVYLNGGSYVLFRGNVYNASDPLNFVVDLTEGLNIINVTLPNSSIVFESGSGELLGYTPGSDSFIVEDVTGSGNVGITLNRYGIPLE